jgi:hypothetical protein
MHVELPILPRATIIALFVASIIGARRAGAAELIGPSPHDNCEPSLVRSLTPQAVDPRWAPHLPQAIVDRYAAAIARGDYPTVIGAIINDADTVLMNTVAPDQAKYRSRLAKLNGDIVQFVHQPAQLQPVFMATTVEASDFQLNQNPSDGTYTLFPGPGQAIVVTAAMTSDVQRALCWPVIAIDYVLTTVGTRWRASTVANLDALASRWDHFVGEGLSQFPWELALNSALYNPATYEPPGRQWILLHPSLGAEVAGRDVKSLQRVDALVVEALGAVWYNADRTRYAGASAVTTLASGANASLGVYTHLWWPQLMAGYVWRSDPVANRQQSFVMSLDLYKFLSGIPAELNRARDSAIGRKLLSITP